MNKGEYLSQEERRAGLLHEVRNSSLAHYLAQQSEEAKSPVEFRIFSPQFTETLQEGDSLGCAIAAYRMALLAQGKPDLGQERTRKLLEKEGFVFGEGGMGVLSEQAASAVGIERAVSVTGLESQGVLNADEIDETRRGTHLTDIALALKKGFLVLGVLPMKNIYPGSNATMKHIFAITGARYWDGQLNFFIHDPLGKAKEISDENLAAGLVESSGTFVAVPTKQILDQKEGDPRVISSVVTKPITRIQVPSEPQEPRVVVKSKPPKK